MFSLTNKVLLILIIVITIIIIVYKNTFISNYLTFSLLKTKNNTYG